MTGYKIIGFNIVDFKGIELVNYDWKGDEGLVVVGDHGEGKSNVIEALDVLLTGAKALKKIDNPVHDGSKKYKISADFKGDGLACFDVGNLFRITATQTTTGIQQLKIENLEGGKPIKASVRDILKTLRGLYVDPHQLMRELETHNGDKKLAANVLKNIGLDLSEFDEKEETLAAQWSADNEEVDRNRKVLESIEIPVEGFPKEKIDIDLLWKESAQYKEYSDRVQNKESNQKLLKAELLNASENYDAIVKDCKSSEIKINEVKGLINKHQEALSIYLEDSLNYLKTVPDLDSPYLEVLERLTESVEQYRAGYKKDIDEINKLKDSLELEKKNFSILSTKRVELDQKVKDALLKIEGLGKTEEWVGLKDKTGELSPDQFITDLIQKASLNNTLYLKKEEYEKAEVNLKSAEASREATNKLRNANKDARTQAVAGSDFQVDGLSINDNGVLTAKVDGRPIVTLKDLNHADKLKVLSEILMVNNAAPLKLIVVKEGYACKPEYQKIIFDQARKHGHTAIMESFTSVDDEGCLWLKDGISSDTPPVDLDVFESDKNIEEQIEGSPDW